MGNFNGLLGANPGDGTLVNDNPDWCGSNGISSTNELLCCPSTCGGTCGGKGNKWKDGKCYDSDDVQKQCTDENDDERDCTQADCAPITCFDDCCDRDINDRTTCETEGSSNCKIQDGAVIITEPEAELCKVDINDIVFTGWIFLFFPNLIQEFKVAVQNNIQNTFTCLYYSAFVLFEEAPCSDLVGSQKTTCKKACDSVRDPAFNLRLGVTEDGQKKKVDGKEYWNYNFPSVVLARQQDRPTFYTSLLLSYGLGDSLASENAATFVVELFEEFMGCSVSVLYCKLWLHFTFCSCLLYCSCHSSSSISQRTILLQVCMTTLIQQYYREYSQITPGLILIILPTASSLSCL